MRISIVYDCLYPWTVGGAERWMRGVSEALAAEGHQVTYLTRRQWNPGDPVHVEGVDVRVVAPMEPLYGPDGQRRIGQAVRFGVGVGRHLARHGGEYDVVHTASFPYFSVLAAAAWRRKHGYRLVVDWHEVWSDAYWRTYLGGAKGRVARTIQLACVRVPQDAFCFAELSAQRLRELGLKTKPTVLRGEWPGTTDRPDPAPSDGTVLYAGRLIPEKRAPALAQALVDAGLRGTVIGDGPDLEAVRRIARASGGLVDAPGFVDRDVLDAQLRTAGVVALASSREGYGMLCVEAFAAGVPVVVVAGPDNAATEFVEDGVNGYVAPSLDALGATLRRALDDGPALRERTADWFAAHAHELSLGTSLDRVKQAYAGAAPRTG